MKSKDLKYDIIVYTAPRVHISADHLGPWWNDEEDLLKLINKCVRRSTAKRIVCRCKYGSTMCVASKSVPAYVCVSICKCVAMALFNVGD